MLSVENQTLTLFKLTNEAALVGGFDKFEVEGATPPIFRINWLIRAPALNFKLPPFAVGGNAVWLESEALSLLWSTVDGWLEKRQISF